jgi:hypothetical protein
MTCSVLQKVDVLHPMAGRSRYARSVSAFAVNRFFYVPFVFASTAHLSEQLTKGMV